MKFGTPVKQSQPFNRDYFHDNFMSDLSFHGILYLLKNERNSSNFRKIRVIVLKLHTNILYLSRNFGTEFSRNRLKRSNFFRF